MLATMRLNNPNRRSRIHTHTAAPRGTRRSSHSPARMFPCRHRIDYLSHRSADMFATHRGPDW